MKTQNYIKNGMNSVAVSADSDDREEGEIVDDDFEDISDNSIIVPLYSGKSVSPKEHLRALSLSSVSDQEEYVRKPKLRSKRRKKRREYYNNCSSGNNSNSRSGGDGGSSDSNAEESAKKINKTLQRQLKQAIRFNIDENTEQKNSLRTRLKAMTQKDFLQDCVDNVNITEVPIVEVQKEETDSELMQLRVDALKTAILNKFSKKRKRKASKDHSDVLEKLEGIALENSNKENVEAKSEQDEDEDVLRANLLASISRKITKAPVAQTENKKTINSAMLTTQKQLELLNNLPQVAPLIIRVTTDSTDSDSDDLFKDNSETTIIVNSNNKAPPVKNSVKNEVDIDKFLKEQRAKVDAKAKETLKLAEKVRVLPAEKSAVKLLPKVKQIEYQRLLKKIQLAEKSRKNGVRVRRNSNRTIEVKLVNNKQAKPADVVKPVEQKTELGSLNKTLRDIQVQRNGRLQIQETYKVLTPILKKINESSIERKKHNQRVKALLEELTQAKKLLMKSHQVFTSSVKELMVKKGEIDKRLSKYKTQAKANHFTSTPNKPEASMNLNISAISTGSVKQNHVKPPVKAKAASPAEPPISSEQNHCSNNPSNPSPAETGSKIPKYVSPLDKVERADDDPLAIYCPFEVDGSCRDPDCTYKHIVVINKRSL